MVNQEINLSKKYVSKAGNAKQAGHDFELMFPQFKRMRMRKTCALTGLPMTVETPTVDRIDNSKGYLPENSAGVRHDINQLKGRMEQLVSTTDDVEWTHILRMVERTIKSIKEQEHGTTHNNC
ncbi:HNH endonuclease [Vibrio phage vB_VspP_pVa5]|uniref:Srd postulated decoy protein n=1 Tax=Vibrio phage vB_VspP_pVa5 TaxID=1913109 RepID=A0A1J0GV59_9CAUD|nr:HNH endonuclease [Vibrio phage vB_VspP_pVa5]APC46065.1 srd postulated decoy protein [Vibrio phage vB_VspP_pVa5]